MIYLSYNGCLRSGLVSVICDDCWHRQRLTFREGKYQEVRVMVYKCAHEPNRPVVFKHRTVRGKTIEFLPAPKECENYKAPPWLTSEKFKMWREQGVKLPWPYFHILPRDWLHRDDWRGRVR